MVNGALLTVLPRTEKVSVLREDLRGWHYLIGVLLFVVAAARLWTWLTERPERGRPENLSSSAWRWNRHHCFALLILILLTALLGFVQGWSEGLSIHLGPFLTLPPLIEENQRWWMFGGYFHSGIGFASLLLTLSMLISAGYCAIRYGQEY